MRDKLLYHKRLNSGGKAMQALSKFCCQNKKCPDYGKRTTNNIEKLVADFKKKTGGRIMNLMTSAMPERFAKLTVFPKTGMFITL